MSDIDYSRASVALYDPVSVNQRTTRYSLHEIGFRDIFQLNTLAELRRLVQDDAPHLIIAETADHETEVFRLVRAIRSGELSNNPFVALLLTSWRRDADLVRNAIGCGAEFASTRAKPEEKRQISLARSNPTHSPAYRTPPHHTLPPSPQSPPRLALRPC